MPPPARRREQRPGVAHFLGKRLLNKLFEFIRSVYVAVLFVLLEALAVSYYARSSYYTEARLLARSNRVIGGAHALFGGVRRYFGLERENRLLLERVAQLEERLSGYVEAETAARLDSYMQELGEPKFRFITASVVANTVNRPRNLITINRGRRNGVVPDMAVLSPDGAMVGYVVDCTDRYAVVLSVLHTSFRASGKLAGGDYLGSVYWDGNDPHIVMLGDLSKYAEPKEGQDVVTTGFSQYFPEGVRIGWVESAELNEVRTGYTVRVRLAAEMSSLTEVLLVENRDRLEIESLQRSERVRQQIRPD